MTDWRALCAELLGALENEGHAHWPGGPDGDPLIEQVRAALAQPEPEGPSDEELDLVVIAIQALIPPQPDATTHHLSAVDRGREILRQRLARWGNPQGT
jgi:hypothetical protein